MLCCRSMEYPTIVTAVYEMIDVCQVVASNNAVVVEMAAMDIRYRGKDITVRANISNQGCALFGLSLVICKKTANGHLAIRAIKTGLEFMNRIGYKTRPCKLHL